jgi:MoaA/NifB/PqqE/SkfB family radical SAM enzyme
MLLAGGPPVVQVHPSLHCNLRCVHCYTSSGPQLRGQLPIVTLRGVLDDAWALGYRQLAVSGGEPLLYDHLTALLDHARSLGMFTTVTTNGMLISEERWAPLAPLVDLLAISIDGIGDDHDHIRGQPGAFAKTIANLPTVRASGCDFGFIFTLTQFNVDSLEAIVTLAKTHGARSVQIHPLTLDGRARVHMGDARPDQLELLVALAEAERLGQVHGVRVHVDALTMQQITSCPEELLPPRPVTRLTEVCPVLTIGADGNVTPLTHDISRSFRLGSVLDERLATLADIWVSRGRAEALAAVCERTWHELVTRKRDTLHATYWFDEVAARSHALVHLNQNRMPAEASMPKCERS